MLSAAALSAAVPPAAARSSRPSSDVAPLVEPALAGAPRKPSGTAAGSAGAPGDDDADDALEPAEGAHQRAHADVRLSDYDAVQAALMEETCIVVDENDNIVGPESKKNCHLNSNIRAGLLHRAFSVFLFDTAGRLLLQQRAAEKITFPSMFTNTCCSHPLHFEEEMENEAQLGVKRAARRKLRQELGISAEEVPLDKFEFLTRIHYCAPSDGIWGEHEIDYILFIQADVTLDVNRNEVMSVKYVTPDELRAMFQDEIVLMTPWFKLIAEKFLFQWWDKLMCSQLEVCRDASTIYRM